MQTIHLSDLSLSWPQSTLPYGFKRIFEAHDMYKPGITSSSSPSVSLQTASLPIFVSLSYSPPVPFSSRGSSCPSSLTSAPEPPQSLPLHSHIVGHYRLVTPYRLLLVPGNRSDLRSPNTKIAVSSGATSVFSSPFTHSRSAVR